MPTDSWGFQRSISEHNIYNASSYAYHSPVKILTSDKRSSVKRLNLGKRTSFSNVSSNSIHHAETLFPSDRYQKKWYSIEYFIVYNLIEIYSI